MTIQRGMAVKTKEHPKLNSCTAQEGTEIPSFPWFTSGLPREYEHRPEWRY